MSDKPLDPKVIKKTQDTLGKIIKKPPLTEKLLSKPPFKFLHDIMTSVIKTTGFMEGLFTDAEMDSENVKDKETKMVFLQKVIDMVSLVTGKPIAAKPSKIVAGHDPDRTNELLQVLAESINKKIDNADYVKRVLKSDDSNTSKKERDASKSKDEGSRDDARRSRDKRDESSDKDKDKERSDRHRNRDKERPRDRSKENEDQNIERDSKSKDREDRHRDRGNGAGGESAQSKDKHRTKDRERDGSKDERKDRHRDKERDEKDEGRSKHRDKESGERKDRQKDKESSSSKHRSKDRDEDKESGSKHRSKDRDEDKESGSKRRSKDGEEGKERERKKERSDRDKRERSREEDEERSKNKSSDEAQPHANNTEESLQRPSSAKGPRKRHGKDDVKDDRNREESKLSASRKAAARPSSARPAPPKPKRNDIPSDEAAVSSGLRRPNVIIDRDEDSDENDFVTHEEEILSPPTDLLPSRDKQDDNLEGEGDHGGLVKKILETKKDYESTAQPARKTEIDRTQAITDASRRKERELVQKDIDRLRASIQTLTRSVNPLGKILDFLQEDLDSMQKELEMYQNENKENAVVLQREQSLTETALLPLRSQLQELESSISDQVDLIAAAKATIGYNDAKISKILSSMAVKS